MRIRTTLRQRDPRQLGGDPPIATLLPVYAARRSEVDVAHARMRAITSGRHAPAQARAAAAELAAALSDATATVVQLLASGQPAPAGDPHRGSARSDSSSVRPWSSELVRLSQIGVWLRRTTLDDLGVHVPTAQRVGSRAATAPHVAGLVAEPDDLVAATLHRPVIGVALQETVDASARVA